MYIKLSYKSDLKQISEHKFDSSCAFNLLRKLTRYVSKYANAHYGPANFL